MPRKGGSSISVKEETRDLVNAMVRREQERRTEERVTQEDVIRGTTLFFLRNDLPLQEVANSKIGRPRKTDGGTAS